MLRIIDDSGTDSGTSCLAIQRSMPPALRTAASVERE